MRSIVIAGVLTLSLTSLAQAQEAVTARRDAAGKIEGSRNFVAYCAECHGANGAGDGKRSAGLARPVPNFTTPKAVVDFSLDRMLGGVGRSHDDQTRAAWSDKLSESDLANIVAYMREAFMLAAPVADASAGRSIFARTCSVCHGDRGNGASWAKNSLNPSPADFTSDKVRNLSRRHMINTVTYGSPGTAMVGFSTQLSRSEIAAVVDYLRATFSFPEGAPENGNVARAVLRSGNAGKHAGHGHRAGPADMSLPLPDGLVGDAAAGRTFFEDNCATCHGKDGKGEGPRAYFINPKPANLQSPEARVELNRPHLFTAVSMGSQGTEMPAWSKVLSPQEIANVAEYVFSAFIHPAEPAAAPSEETKKKD